MRFTGAWHEDDEVSYPRPSSDAAAAGNDVDVAAVAVVGTSASMMMTAQHSSLLAPPPLTCVREEKRGAGHGDRGKYKKAAAVPPVAAVYPDFPAGR